MTANRIRRLHAALCSIGLTACVAVLCQDESTRHSLTLTGCVVAGAAWFRVAV